MNLWWFLLAPMLTIMSIIMGMLILIVISYPSYVAGKFLAHWVVTGETKQ